MRRSAVIATLILACAAFLARADETCNSPYMTKLIKGQEDYVYVWTLGVEGLGDGSDKLVTVDVNPKSKRYGKVIHSVSIGARVEAHHMGFTDDRRHIWAAASRTIASGCSISPAIRRNRRSCRRSPTWARSRAGSGRIPTMRCRAGCWCRRCRILRTRAAAPAWRSTTTRAS